MTKHLDRIQQTLLTYETIISQLQIDKSQKEIILSSWLNAIKTYEALCKRNFIYSNISGITLIICSAAVPALINIEDDVLRIIATVLSVLVTISAGLRQRFRFTEKWKHFRNMSELLKIEGEKYFALTDGYEREDNHIGAFKMFTKKIALIKEGQIVSYIERVATDDNENTESGSEK